MVLPWVVLYVVCVFVYLILTPKGASPPVLGKDTGNEIDEKVSSPASQAASDSETGQGQLLEYSQHSGRLSRRSYSHATRHSW